MSDNIGFHSENTFLLSNQKMIQKWINESIANEGWSIGEINIIFCDDAFLLKKNIEFLNHNTLTDIITFNYNQDKIIFGDLFISTERVDENAKIFNVTFEHELNRVIIHGILHLMEYNDKSKKEQLEMRKKENDYLEKI